LSKLALFLFGLRPSVGFRVDWGVAPVDLRVGGGVGLGAGGVADTAGDGVDIVAGGLVGEVVSDGSGEMVVQS
jgi:hypothetical protein